MITLISGRAGEGKSTFARICTTILIEDYDEGSIIIPLAAKVKDTIKFMGWNGKKDKRGRALLQAVGNIGREYDDNLWADHVVDFIQSQPVLFNFTFIDDWRFPNEFDVVAHHFYPTIKVKICRPKEFHDLYGTLAYDDISETSLPSDIDYYDFIIQNDGDIEDLERKAERFVKETLLKRGKK